MVFQDPYSIFISHSTADKPFVEGLAHYLNSNGVHTFLDNYEILTGESIVDRIVNGIYNYDYFTVILTPNAIESSWVLRELQMAIWRWVDELKMKRLFIIPVLKENCDIWDGIKDLKYVDFRKADLIRDKYADVLHSIHNPTNSSLFRTQLLFEPTRQNISAYKIKLSSSLKLKSPLHVSRKLVDIKNGHSSVYDSQDKNGSLLIELVLKKRLIQILSEAGKGKTEELISLALILCEEKSIFIPVFASLNKYVKDRLDDYIPDLKEFPDENTVIILDGFDEIESENKNAATRSIEHYAEIHPKCRIVISSRENLYQPISGFDEYHLLDYTVSNAKRYISNALGKRANRFDKRIFKTEYDSLILHPFYLNLLVRYFNDKNDLPEHKSDLIEYFIRNQLNEDAVKYQTTYERFNRKRKKIFSHLKRLALIMEYLGRNTLSEDELNKIVVDERETELILSSGLISVKNTDPRTVQFQHNNFQEYLAAFVLSLQSVKAVKEFTAFKPDYIKTKPSWLNTISFILSLTKSVNEIYSWLLEIEPEVLIKCEPDRIEKTIRFEIFKHIFEDYKSKRIYIARETPYNVTELCRFANIYEAVDYLINILATVNEPTVLDNAVYVLRFMTLTSSQKARCERLFLGIAINPTTEKHLRSAVLLTMANQKINSHSIVIKIVDSLKDSEETWIRYALYYYLYESEYIEEFVEIFIDGLKYIRSGLVYDAGSLDMRLGDEAYHLQKGVENIKSPHGLKIIINHFIKYERDFKVLYLSENPEHLITNGIAAYKQDVSIFDQMAELFIRLLDTHQEKTVSSFLRFFNETNTKLKLFNKIYNSRIQNDDWYSGVGAIIDDESINIIIKDFQTNKISEREIWVLNNFVQWKNQNKNGWFLECMNRHTDGKFVLSPQRDYESERRSRFQKDINLIFDKNKYVDEIKLIYQNDQNRIMQKEDIRETRSDNMDTSLYSDLVLRELEQLVELQPRSMDDIVTEILKYDWNYYSTFQIYNYLSNGCNINLSPNQWMVIKTWCYNQLKVIDFRTALQPSGNRGSSTNHSAVMLWYFIRHEYIECANNIYLDLLSFDWVENSNMAGIKYIESKLEDSEITERVLENLSIGINDESVLNNHLDYCKRHAIEEVSSYATEIIKNNSYSEETRNLAINTLIKTDNGLTQIKILLNSMGGEILWKIIEKTKQLLKEDVICKLKIILKNGEEKDKNRAASNLVDLNELDGLNYLVESLIKNKRAPGGYEDGKIYGKIILPEAIEPLYRLLDVTYDPDFIDNSFYSIRNTILSALSLIAINYDMLNDIKSKTLNFIENNLTKNDSIRFLHVFIKGTERDYWINKSNNITLGEAISAANSIEF